MTKKNFATTQIFHKSQGEKIMETIGKKLAKIRGRLTQKEFAELFGISRATYANYEQERFRPDAKFLEDIGEKFDINLNWLILGKGQMHINDKKPFKNFASFSLKPPVELHGSSDNTENDGFQSKLHIEDLIAVMLIEEAIKETGYQPSEQNRLKIINHLKRRVTGNLISRTVDALEIVKEMEEEGEIELKEAEY